jgi:hypothetical protein
MMQDNTPINFYIKHFFINCQIKKLQPIFDTFVPPCIENIQTKLCFSDPFVPLFSSKILKKCCCKSQVVFCNLNQQYNVDSTSAFQ